MEQNIKNDRTIFFKEEQFHGSIYLDTALCCAECRAACASPPLPCGISASQTDVLSVSWDGGEAVVTAPDTAALVRACFLLTQADIEGRRELHIRQERHIDSCGAFIDCSRGAVMTVEACKRYLDHLAALGLNLFVMYMEDTYTVPE